MAAFAVSDRSVLMTVLVGTALVARAGLQPASGAFAADAIRLVLPADAATRTRVVRASAWLDEHIVQGTLSTAPELGPLSLVAWHDPSLAPQDQAALAAYAITDSLWAARALTLHSPAQSAAITRSLIKLNCQQNNLHEVLFQPIAAIHHRSADEDLVHGALLGTFQRDRQTISVRSFRMRFDADYSIGHPALFAEHAVYQSLFHDWKGQTDLARQHLIKVFQQPFR